MVAAALIWLRGAALLATRIAAQYVIPARLLLATATRAAGARFVVATAHIILAVLTLIVLAEKVFGLQRQLKRTLAVKATVKNELETSLENKSMLELALRKSRAFLSSVDDLDDDSGDGGDGGDGGDVSCPLCGGTGKIVYEGKMRHEDPCPRCAMIGRGG